jgi:hypothetical protein
MVAGALHLPEHRRPGEARDRYDKSSDEDDDMRSSANGKNIRGNSNKDDSDFEFDL